MDKLLIHLTDAEQVECLLVSEHPPSAQQMKISLADAAGHGQGRQVIVLVPSEQVILTEVAVPTANRQRQRLAVPYLLEDLLVADVDQLHFALGSYEDGKVAVAVVAHEQMRHWMEQLAKAGIQPKFMAPDVLALPLREEAWSVALTGDMATIRTGLQSGFSCDADNLPLLLDQALQLAENRRPARLQAVTFPRGPAWHPAREGPSAAGACRAGSAAAPMFRRPSSSISFLITSRPSAPADDSF